MKSIKVWHPLLAVAVLVLATLACGTTNDGQVIGTNAPQTTVVQPIGTNAPQTAVVQPTQAAKVGDVIQLKDHTITLNSAVLQGGTVKANFTIVNTGSSTLPISSFMLFTAKDSGGTKLDPNISSCDPLIDGFVVSNDNVTGNICWNATTLPIKIYYRPELLVYMTVVWVITK